MAYRKVLRQLLNIGEAKIRRRAIPDEFLDSLAEHSSSLFVAQSLSGAIPSLMNIESPAQEDRQHYLSWIVDELDSWIMPEFIANLPTEQDRTVAASASAKAKIILADLGRRVPMLPLISPHGIGAVFDNVSHYPRSLTEVSTSITITRIYNSILLQTPCFVVRPNAVTHEPAPRFMAK